MKELMLLRHAKAEAAASGMSDIDRPLAARGVRDAGLVGRAMAGEPLPEMILCSPARRTRETLTEILAALPNGPKVEIVDALYDSRGATYATTIARHGGDADRILVIGHNPTVHATAVALAALPGAKLAAKFPTCALAVLAFDTATWAGIDAGGGRLVSFRRPRDLGALDADD